MDLWIKIAIIVLIAIAVYREILKSAQTASLHPDRTSKAGFITILGVGSVVGMFTYAGMSMTWVETRDLRPYHPENSSQFVSLMDRGVIELNGMVIKTNLAREGELAPLAEALTQGCNRDDGCEAQKLFDYVTAIPYRTDHTSRNALTVVKSNWGDCDDKSNLFASLLDERGIEYRFVYVPHHVFVAVHLNDTKKLPFLNAKLTDGGAKISITPRRRRAAQRSENLTDSFPTVSRGYTICKRIVPKNFPTSNFRPGKQDTNPFVFPFSPIR